MKNTIKRLPYVAIILFVCLCLHLEGCQKKLVHVEKDGIVEGFVKDSLSSIPIAGTEILSGTPPDTAFITKTDSTGYYKFPDFPGRKDVTAKADGYELQTKTVEIIVNKTTILDFFLNRK